MALGELLNLPPWVAGALRSPQALKLLFRCWLASFACYVLLLPNKSLATLGNAGFFGFLASLIFPAAMQLQPFLFGIALLMLGQLLGWGIGSAGMRSALAARSQVLLRQTLESVDAGLAGQTDPDAGFEIAIFEGRFLDTRSSICYGCFLALSVFVFALIRVYYPRLTLLAMFGTIMVDIFCTYGPLFPTPDYTIVDSLLISTSCYAAIAVIMVTFVFPQTMSHAQMAATASILGKVRALTEFQSKRLEEEDLEGLAPGGTAIRTMAGMRSDIMGAFQTLNSKSGMINLEFSYGAWNGDDVRDLEPLLLTYLTRATSVQSYFTVLGSTYIPSPAITPTPSNTTNDTTTTDQTQKPTSDSYLLRQLRSRHTAAEAHFNVRPLDLLPVVRTASADLRTAYHAALEALEAELHRINNARWSRKDLSPSDEVVAALDALRVEFQAFKETKRAQIMDPFRVVFETYRGPGWQDKEHPWEDDEAHAAHVGTGSQRVHPDAPSQDMPLRALYISAVFASNLVWTVDGFLAFADAVVDTSRHHHKNRLWAPKGLRAIGKVIASREVGEEGFGEDVRPDVEIDPELGKIPDKLRKGWKKGDTKASTGNAKMRRDPDSLPPTNIFQRMMNLVHHLYMWLMTAEAVFAIKYVIITILLWLPSVFKSSAYFYYTEKGVWALIMAQTTMNVYAADQMYNLVARTIGTFLGLVVGALAWYIGAQKTKGTPYGVAASTGVFLIPVMFNRLFAPPRLQVPTILFSATFALILGYSWIDGHLATFGNPGVGWSIAWRRFVLVMIGNAASFIIMLIPPVSARKAIRLRNASSILSISQVYSFLMSTWIADHLRQPQSAQSGSMNEKKVSDAQDVPSAAQSCHSTGDVEKGDIDPKPGASYIQQSQTLTEEWRNAFRAQFVPLIVQLQALKAQTAIARWEGHVRGAWPFELYDRLVDEQGVMLANLSQLAGVLANLNPERREALLHRTRCLNPHFITDVLSVFSHLSQSLRTGRPLLAVLPHKLVDRLFYHHSLATRAQFDQEDEDAIATFEENLKHLKSLDTMYFAAGVVAVWQILGSLDTIHDIVVQLCGEIPFEGFEQWTAEYEMVHSG